jgi:hypothetical protein
MQAGKSLVDDDLAGEAVGHRARQLLVGSSKYGNVMSLLSQLAGAPARQLTQIMQGMTMQPTAATSPTLKPR